MWFWSLIPSRRFGRLFFSEVWKKTRALFRGLEKIPPLFPRLGKVGLWFFQSLEKPAGHLSNPWKTVAAGFRLRLTSPGQDARRRRA
jgi:hypothetical protein